MNRSLRFLLGIVVLATLVPMLVFTAPKFFGNPHIGAERGSSAVANAFEPGSETDIHSLIDPWCPPVGCLGEESAGATLPENPRSSSTVNNSSTSRPVGSSAPDSTTTTTKAITSAPSTTHVSENATTSLPNINAAGTITGRSCPCTVGGVAELKGTVNLEGDLVVVGGTLIARPGVLVNGNGYQIMFMKGGKADFQGSPTSTWSGDGSNSNVNRDINFNNLRRIMFHEGAGKSTLRYFAINDSGTPTLGDYSLHFHMNGNTTRGTLVEGVAVVNSRHHAFVPHASHGITFKDTIAKNGKCEAYWWDPPEFQSTSQVNNSNDILYDHALADGVKNCPGDDRGFRLSAFELGAGKGNAVRNSVARNVTPTHAKDCSGFKWPEVSIKQPSTWGFANNASYGSKCNGIFVWQNDYEEHIVNGFSGDGIDHGAYVNRFDYRNIDVPFIEIHALGWTATGGRASQVTVFRHTVDGGPVTFTDVTIGRFTVHNASGGGTMPGTYILNGTGLSCGEIVYDSVVPKTRVVIDGKEC